MTTVSRHRSTRRLLCSTVVLAGLLLSGACAAPQSGATAPVTGGDAGYGDRPLQLVADMDAGPLKDRLLACRDQPMRPTNFAIGHRGAPLNFPEHTRASYAAAIRQGAGLVECDVTFTADRELVCRHAQCDLHSTTNILRTGLAGRCVEPFSPARGDTPARARCCTSDLSLEQFRSLCGRRDVVDPSAESVEAYLEPGDDLEGGDQCGTLMTHDETIRLFRSRGVGMIPELKTPEVPMPFQGEYERTDYADQFIDAYRRAGVEPTDVRPQSFDLADIAYWLDAYPEYGRQAIYLDGRVIREDFDADHPERLEPTMPELVAMGVRTIAPPIWVLVTVADGRIVPSAYARAAKAAGLDIVTWTLERPGTVSGIGGFYFHTVATEVDNEGDVYTVLDVLAREVGVIGVFSDWPATVTYYANCIGL